MVEEWRNDRPGFDPSIDPPLGAVNLSVCTDGLGNTLLISEVANGPLVVDADATRVSECYMIPPMSLRTSMAQAQSACNAIDWRNGTTPWNGTWRYKGHTWAEGTIWKNWFNTIRTPNQTCCTDGRGAGVNWWWILKPASSYHPGIVNAALADGSVRAFKETINPATWMSLSTRSGNETISAGDF
jgi:hypothetical protein